MSTTQLYEKEVTLQADRRRSGVELIKIISDLWYDKSIELVLFRNHLIDRNVSEILNLHEYAGEFVGKPISILDSVEIASVILSLDLPPSKLDIGKLTYEYGLLDEKYPDVYIGKVNIVYEQELIEEYSVMSSPVLIFFKNGEEVDRITGAVSKHKIEEAIEKNK